MGFLVNYLKKQRPQLRLYAPGEPGQHQQLLWLVQFIGALKGDIKRLKEEKRALALQLKNSSPLTVEEQELLDLRYQVQMLWFRNAKLEKTCYAVKCRNKELQDQLNDREWENMNAA